ncbi:MAG: hypothetical protein V8S27_01860 [Lachnospiraceae bacterium]
MRAIVFMPKYVAMSSAAVVFLWIFNKDNGIFNYLLSLVGLPAVDSLGNRHMALISVLMLTGWRCVGYGMMVYLAAMMGIARITMRQPPLTEQTRFSVSSRSRFRCFLRPLCSCL